MKSAGSIALIFLTLISNGLMLDLSKFWGMNQAPIVMEPARPIEIVTWRQPVCLMPAQGVSPCYLGLRKLQDEYDRVSGKGVFQETRSSVSSQDEVLTSSESDVPSASNLATLQSSENSEEAAIGRSQSRTPELTLTEDNIEEGRYLGIRGETPKPQQIYVSRVINAPMTATLVAHTCLPDIGIPLCQDYQPIQPSKPVFDSQPAETGSPTISNKPGNCQNPNHVFHDNQNFATTLHDPVVKPIPTRRPIQQPESSLVQAVCHSCVQNGVTSGKLGHVVISKPGGEVVEARPLATGGSPFHYFDSASHLDQQIKSEFNIQLSKNSGSEIEGQAVDERPHTASQTLDQLITTFNNQSLKNSGSREIEGQGPEAETSERKKSKNTIVQTVHDVINTAGKLPIVQKVQSFLQRPGHEEGSSEGSAFLGNIFRPINLFNRKRESTMSRPESSTQIVQTSSVSSTSGVEESTNVSVIEIMEKPAIMDILHKPENNISNSPGLLDIFESARPVDNVDAESLAKPTEKPGLLGDLFANPVGPIEAENGKVKTEGN